MRKATKLICSGLCLPKESRGEDFGSTLICGHRQINEMLLQILPSPHSVSEQHHYIDIHHNQRNITILTTIQMAINSVFLVFSYPSGFRWQNKGITGFTKIQVTVKNLCNVSVWWGKEVRVMSWLTAYLFTFIYLESGEVGSKGGGGCGNSTESIRRMTYASEVEQQVITVRKILHGI